MNEPKIEFDWQGHRGARGLMPENTIPAFLKALEFPVTTLELDLAVSKDNQLVVSHEPYFSHEICSRPDGKPVLESEEDSLLIFDMTYTQIAQFDCGSRGNGRFPQQQKIKAPKPTLAATVQAVEQFCKKRKKKIRYNIEIKSQANWDGKLTPPPAVFAQLVKQEIEKLGIQDRVCVQSFDVRVLEAFHKISPQQTLAYLVENEESIADNLKKLSFKPAIYSPYYLLLNKTSIDYLHKEAIKVIPWTVNDVVSMQALIVLGVDGIITDYPNLIEKIDEK